MSQPLDLKTEAKQPSHVKSKSDSEMETELEDKSTASEADVFCSIRFPAPPFFPKPYLHNWDSINFLQAEKYKMKHFNPEMIHNSLQLYPDHSKDFIYYNTYVNVAHFTSLQHHIDLSIQTHNACLQLAMVSSYCQIPSVWWFKSSINQMHPIVEILCSAPTYNTRSWKRNCVFENPAEELGDNSIDQSFSFTLPNSLDDESIVQVIQGNTTSYDLQELHEDSFAQWKEMKKEEAKSRQMKRIRERAGVLKQLKRELRQCHKLSQTENCFPGVRWWHVKYWEGDMGLKVKKEESLTPPLPQYPT